MSLTDIELKKVKNKILESFNDPIPDGALRDFLLKKSKFIRSRLTILYLKTCGCNITDEVLDIIAAGEIIHNASLLHDDVIDDAELRRNESTIAKRYTSKISILAGDYLIALAINHLLNIKNEKILEIFKTCVENMAKSEIEQFFLRGKVPDKDRYLEICKGKTANLFASMLQGSAILSGIDEARARSFGESFGVYFQLRNDLNEDSAKQDFLNEIYTVKDVMGIENTRILLDNYKEEMGRILREIPQNIYRKTLEDLINNYD